MIIYISIGLFTLAAIFGITILIRWLQKKDAPKGVVYTHGTFAVAGLVVLVAYAIMHPAHFPSVSLALFPLAAIAGVYMFFRYEHQKTKHPNKKHKHPVSVAFIHAFFAVAGLTTLLVFTFTGKLANQISHLIDRL
jgi:Ca2+/Na+ antiporter